MGRRICNYPDVPAEYELTEDDVVLIDNEELGTRKTSYANVRGTFTFSGMDAPEDIPDPFGNNGDFYTQYDINNKIVAMYNKVNGEWVPLPKGGGSTISAVTITEIERSTSTISVRDE